MLTCITCKQKIEDDDEREDGRRGTPEAVKSLTAQIKDIAVKVSGAYKCKSSLPSSCRKGQRPNPDFDALTSEGVPFPYHPGSASSTPAWDFANAVGHFRTPRPPADNPDRVEEWTAQVEPGIQITFVSLPRGGNDLKRIRFSRDMFDKWQAQRWWGENYDRIMELYNVERFNQPAPSTPSRSEDGRDSSCSRLESSKESPMVTPPPPPPALRHHYKPLVLPDNKVGSSAYASGAPSSMDASRTTAESRDERGSISLSNASEMESEWIEQDQPGVYITIRQLVDGTRELRRVRFSRERFGEMHAKMWWEQNRERIQAEYL